MPTSGTIGRVRATLQAAQATLADQAQRPAAAADFAESVMSAVRDVVPFDGYCLLGLDPCSGLRSFLFSRHGLDGVADRLAYNEAVQADLHRYADLARAEVPVGVLSATGRAAPNSPRLHEILRPAGFHSELRLALRGEGRLWGALVLFRADPRRPFTDADAALTLDLAGPLRGAVRRYPVRVTPAVPDPLPPGVVLLDRDNKVVSITEEARAWLDDIRAGGLDEVDAEDVLRVVYDVGLAARAVGGHGRATTTEAAPVCHVRTTSGRWLLVQGERLGPSSEAVVVILQPAALRQLLPAAAAWFGLTRRETEVLRLIALGLPAKQMARHMQLSVHTVNDHLRAIYRKASVRGRDELLARLT